jgi:hypothetical protein
VKGAANWVTIARLIEREMLPLAISVKHGVENLRAWL